MMSNRFSVVRTVLRRMVLTIVALLIGIVVGGQMGLFAGKRSPDLGVHEGRLKPAPPTPNCVSSQSTGGYSKIAPFTYAGDGRKAMARLHDLVGAMPAAKIIESRPEYLYTEFTSRWIGFVDDVEFYLDEKAAVIHVRSASRLGHGDHGVNRQRVEAIRAALGNN